MNPRITLPILLSLLILLSCEQKKNEFPFVSVKPSDIEIEGDPGDFITFDIDVFSDYRLDRFIISRKLTGTPEQTVWDTTLTIKNFSFLYDFLIPENYFEDNLLLFFTAINENGNQRRIKKTIQITETLMQELTGVRMYSSLSDNESGYNLMELESVSSNSPVDSLDILDYSTDTVGGALGNEWHSPSGGEFVSFNDMNYAQATHKTAAAAFEAGNKLTEISNLEVNDIIIIRASRSNEPSSYFVIKMVAINDEAGVENDYYEFNLKY